MQLWNNLNTLWLLCVFSMLGIVGMLLLEGFWDVMMLLVTALPLSVAVYRALQINKG